MKAEQIEQARQAFRNHSDCYADTTYVGENGEHVEGAVVQAITEETFISLLSSLEKNILMEFVKDFNEIQHSTVFEKDVDEYLI